MAGLIDTGTSYRTRALSGLLRVSQEQAEVDSANKELKASEKAQGQSMGAMGAGLGYLAFGGPIGAIGGLALGYLFSRIF